MKSEKLEALGKDTSSNRYNSNKLVKIYKGGVPWQTSSGSGIVAPGLELYLENDFSPQFNNDWEPVLKKLMESFPQGTAQNVESAVKILEMIKAVPANVRYVTKYSNIQGWKNTSPISFSMNFTFNMGQAGAYDGRTEVYNPIAVLAHLCLPKETNGLLYGPGLSSVEAMTSGLAAQWATVKQAFSNIRNEKTKSELESKRIDDDLKNLLAKHPNVIKIVVGKMVKFNFCLCEDCSYSFSKEIDTNGFPIEGKINIKFSTYTVATADDIPIAWR